MRLDKVCDRGVVHSQIYDKLGKINSQNLNSNKPIATHTLQMETTKSISFIDVLALTQYDNVIKITSWSEEGIVTFRIENEEKLASVLRNSPQNFLQLWYDQSSFVLIIEYLRC